MTTHAALPPKPSWHPLVELALAEDLGLGDITTLCVLSSEVTGQARIEAREPLVVCGAEVAREVFHRVDPSLGWELHIADGDTTEADQPLITLRGSIASMLAAERTALNFLGRMCGVASLTRRYVERVAGTRAEIVDTRKTLPGWRALDKYAVAVGGGTNHRMGLHDGILIKDNHVAAAGGVASAYKAARAAAPAHLRIQIEVESERQAAEACEAGADFLLLDNCTPDEMCRIHERWGTHALLEASGGVGLDNVEAIARSGVHRISIGALTHSAPCSDVALEIEAGGVPE